MHDRKYTHSPANGIRYAAIRCFTKEPHRGDNYFTLFVILALQRKKTGDSQPLDVKTGGIQPKLNVACFVQSCLTDADFVLFSNYCLIGTRPILSRSIFYFFAWSAAIRRFMASMPTRMAPVVSSVIFINRPAFSRS